MDGQANTTIINNIFDKESQFKSEKDMCDYIETNIIVFCRELFDDTYINHKREYKIYNQSGRGQFTNNGRPNVRIDFVIRCKNKVYAIEVKNPKQVHTELSRSIGQIMMYQTLTTKKGIEMVHVLVSSKHSDIVSEMISFYNLNIRYHVFNKKGSAEYVKINR